MRFTRRGSLVVCATVSPKDAHVRKNGQNRLSRLTTFVSPSSEVMAVALVGTGADSRLTNADDTRWFTSSGCVEARVDRVDNVDLCTSIDEPSTARCRKMAPSKVLRGLSSLCSLYVGV